IDSLRADLHKDLASDKTPEEVFGVLLDLLTLDGTKEASTLAARLRKRWPERFETDHEIAFAERGNAEMADGLRALYAKTPAEDRSDLLEVAAWLAFHGSRSGHQTLREVLREKDAAEWVEVPFLREAWLAGKALEALGEKDPLAAYRTKLR